MGVLVRGAEKAERQVECFKVKLQRTKYDAGQYADAHVRRAWKSAQNKFEREKENSLRISELKARRILKRIIGATIQQLEKVNKRLE